MWSKVGRWCWTKGRDPLKTGWVHEGRPWAVRRCSSQRAWVLGTSGTRGGVESRAGGHLQP